MTMHAGSSARPASPAVRHRPDRADLRGRLRAEQAASDSGFTLVELLIAMTILLIVLTLATTIIGSFFSNQTRITATYNGFDEILPATTTMQRFAITMVEATPPTVTGGVYVPVPPYRYSATGYQLSPNSATFTSDVGDPNGPSLITISTTANAAPRSGSPQTYTVTATSTGG
jgi:prepilin-type N-terminal cleavage/methylation domain-containing protein